MIAVAGCSGETPDPRLCEICKRLDEIKDAPLAVDMLERQNLHKKREEKATNVIAFYEWGKKPKTLPSCPGCNSVYAEIYLDHERKSGVSFPVHPY